MPPPSEPDPSETLGPYTLLRKIGAGGMGEVLLAWDPRLDREVALKRLPAELGDDPDRRQRFLREARAAAKLSHPNITAIHEVGEADGRDYIAFEYVEGRTLQELVEERPLTLAELIDLALPIADALAYAHERGVIHRDLKAANVMVTSRGHAKLLDFGLAKLLHEEGAGGERKSPTLTMEGAIFGTPQAMSPEQALGRPVDQRSDVFSFGSLLYEMAAGRAAFQGDTVMEVVDAVIHSEPTKLTRLRPDLPPDFAAIVDKAMRKDPGERYPSIAGLVADLKHFKRQAESGPVPVARPRRRVLPAALASLVVVAGLAWIFLRSDGRDGTEGTPPTALPPSSIAVMGFELIGADGWGTDKASLDRALTSLVTTALAEAGGIDVASSSKVVACLRQAGQPAGGTFDPGIAAEAARTAEVELMLVGQVLARASGLVLTAELVDVASGNALDSLRREVSSEEDVFALAEGLASDVRRHLGLEGVGRSRIDLERDLTDSPEAYYKFVAGEMALHEARFVDARRLLGQAIELDPSFALAYFRLGLANDWEADPDEATRAYEGALAHADRLPERWQRLVQVVLDYSLGDMEGAYTGAEELIAEGHAMPEVHNVLGEVLTHSTRRRDPIRALQSFLRALEIDPNFQIVLYHVVGHSIEIGKPEAIEDLLVRLRAEGANPAGLEYLETGLAMARRDHATAVARIELAGRQIEDLETYVWSLVELGRLEKADAVLASLSPEPNTNNLRNQLQYQGTVAFRQGRIRDALQLFRASGSSLPAPPDGGSASYAANLAFSWLGAARIAMLVGSIDEAQELLEEGLRVDPYDVSILFWKARWLAAQGRTEEAAPEVERMRPLVSASASPIASGWLALAEAELSLAEGDLARARQWLGTLADTPRGWRPWCATELVRAGVARAAGDAPAEVEAWRSALDAARDFSEFGSNLVLPVLYGLADAEERAGEVEAAREHGRELLAIWGEGEDAVAIVADARRRWGD